MSYVDGFLLPLPKENLDAYLEMSRKAGEVWKEYGAIDYVECVADDVPDGEVTSFPMSVKLEPGEVVVFSWITYASREERDRINEQVMKDPRIAGMDPATMPFDGKRMMWGGFRPVLSL